MVFYKSFVMQYALLLAGGTNAYGCLWWGVARFSHFPETCWVVQFLQLTKRDVNAHVSLFIHMYVCVGVYVRNEPLSLQYTHARKCHQVTRGEVRPNLNPKTRIDRRSTAAGTTTSCRCTGVCWCCRIWSSRTTRPSTRRSLSSAPSPSSYR